MDFVSYLRRKLLSRAAGNPTIQQITGQEELRAHVNEQIPTFGIVNVTDQEFACFLNCIEEHRSGQDGDQRPNNPPEESP